MTVAVLFCLPDSVYKTMPDLDVYDEGRNALTYSGTAPVIAHPPCRAWSRMRGLARPPAGERELAPWAVEIVRRNGGILEHPGQSLLWRELALPMPGGPVDQWGGFSLSVDQHWWGHLAQKKTWLYICGLSKSTLPQQPITLDEPEYTLSLTLKKYRTKREIPKRLRSATPPAFAEWLIELASRCAPPTRAG